MFKQLRQLCLPLTAGKQCLVMCVLALVACLVPSARFEPARDAVERVLAPGQQAIAPGVKAARALVHRVAQLWQSAAKLSQLEAQVGELEALNRDLAWQLRSAASTAPSENTPPAAVMVEPLIAASLVEAHVLGGQARNYLARRDLLDVGRSVGVRPQALVLTPPLGEPAVLDAGHDQGLAPHERVLATAGGALLVWGKLVSVGRLTSTLQRANDAGYRDLVQLAHVTAAGLRWGTRGVLEGRGERLCRLTRVDLDAPVDIGDLVFAADSAGLHATPGSSDSDAARLLYGSVVRLERPAAEPHWNIWIEPAIAPERDPTRVAVVSLSLNPARTARPSASVSSSSQPR